MALSLERLLPSGTNANLKLSRNQTGIMTRSRPPKLLIVDFNESLHEFDSALRISPMDRTNSLFHKTVSIKNLTAEYTMAVSIKFFLRERDLGAAEGFAFG
jgi:hypothetical protein